jgi:hypothetical protein
MSNLVSRPVRRPMSRLGLGRIGLLAVLLATAAFIRVECPQDGCYTREMVNFSLPSWLSLGRAKPTAAIDIDRGVRHFGIYYGWPSQVNGAGGDVERSAAEFARFAVIVLGDGLEHPNHPDHANTAAIIARVNAGGTTRVFGYVDLGVTTQNLPPQTIVQFAEEWKRIGATGIFLDDAGADYGVDAARRDRTVGDIRQLGLPVILNAHDPADAFRGKVPLSQGDGYLFESFQVSDGRVQPASEMLAKADLALQLAGQGGPDVYALASGPRNDPGLQAKLSYAWWSTLMYGFRYFQYTSLDYGSASSELPWYPLDVPDIGERYLEPTVQHLWNDGLHRRATNRGAIEVNTGAAIRGMFVPREVTPATQGEGS